MIISILGVLVMVSTLKVVGSLAGDANQEIWLVWSALYSYSFEQKSDWSREYPGQEELLVCLPQVMKGEQQLTANRTT